MLEGYLFAINENRTIASKNGVFRGKLKAIYICAFLSYQARLKLPLKCKEKMYILTTSSFELPSKNDVLR